MKIESPPVVFGTLWNRIPRHLKTTFVATIILGLFVHMQFMANMLLNHDSAPQLREYGSDYLSQGRWIGFFWEGLRGRNYSLTWVNSAMALVFLALASCLAVSCLAIGKTVYCLVLSWLVVSFPTTVCNFTYDAYYFSFAFLLACLAAYVAARTKHGLYFAWVFVALTLSAYQGYISVIVGLLISALAIDVLRRRFWEAKDLVITGTKYLFSIAIGYGAYTLALNLFLRAKNVQLTEYMGINEFGGLTWANLRQRLYDVYAYGFQYYFKDTYAVHNAVYLGFIDFKILFVVMAFIAGVAIVATVLVEKLYKNVALTALLALLLFLLPLGCHIVAAVAPTGMHLTMMYGLLVPLLFMLALLDTGTDVLLPKLQGRRRWFAGAGCWVLLAVLGLYAINYSELASQAYMRLELMNKQATAYATMLFARIQSEDFYTPERTIVLAGHAPVTASIASLGETDRIAGVTKVIGPGMWSYTPYLENQLGIKQNIRYLNRNLPLSQRELEALLEMPIYPAPGSIRLVGEEIFVRIAEWDYIVDK